MSPPSCIDLSSRVSTLLGPQQPVPSSGEVGGQKPWAHGLADLSANPFHRSSLAASRVEGASVRMCPPCAPVAGFPSPCADLLFAIHHSVLSTLRPETSAFLPLHPSPLRPSPSAPLPLLSLLVGRPSLCVRLQRKLFLIFYTLKQHVPSHHPPPMIALHPCLTSSSLPPSLSACAPPAPPPACNKP